MAKNDFQYGGWKSYTLRCGTITTLISSGNNNNNKHDNVYGAVIMTEPLREFTRFI